MHFFESIFKDGQFVFGQEVLKLVQRVLLKQAGKNHRYFLTGSGLRPIKLAFGVAHKQALRNDQFNGLLRPGSCSFRYGLLHHSGRLGNSDGRGVLRECRARAEDKGQG